MEDLRIYIEGLEFNGYIKKDGTPIKCIFCDSKDLKRTNESYGPVGLEECEVICQSCNKITGRWAYGNWCID